ncbi:MAG: putative DNA binding domain-containing protein [Bacteroidetes bacterium]|nr:putative DNA binding domain-containing protein [Bacteroidota bacterium]MBU1678543.1 putative DNA binding domain-containing protein [Bacteroidota bacterium]MBU2505893.1 putative DNA binding domain-containing protein [Bacteroidota bacterium]
MKPKELLRLIEAGENSRIEFKQRFSDFHKIAKEIIAFANSQGGYVIFGIDDDRSIYGVMSEKSEAELFEQTVREYCQPAPNYKLHFVGLFDKEIVVAEILESKNKPHRIQDYKLELDPNTAEVYIRVNDKSIPAGKEMIKILQAESSRSELNKYKIGKDEKLVFDFLQEVEFITAKDLIARANISSRRASRTLIKLVRAGLLNIHTKDNGENYFSSRK